MRRAALFGFFSFLLVIFAALPVRADDFNPPGLRADAQRYAADLHKRAPAGGNPAARKAADDQIAAAAAKNDAAALATALEARIAQGQETPKQWLDLATALLNRTPPDAKKAVAAAWNAYTATDEGPKQASALLLIAQALRTLDRLPDAVLALEHAERNGARQRHDQAASDRDAQSRRGHGAETDHRGRGRSAPRLHCVLGGPGAPAGLQPAGLGAARSAAAGHRGDARGRPALHLRPAARRARPHRAARRPARARTGFLS